MIIEHTSVNSNQYTVVHSCYGRRTNDALSRALAYLVGKMNKCNVQVILTDSCFVLVYNGPRTWVKKALKLLKKSNLNSILVKAINRTEILKRRFRHCAGRSLMILRTYKGKQKNVGRQQVSAQILLNAVKELDSEFPILKEARREVLEDLMDLESAEKVLDRIRKGKIEVNEVRTPFPSPFALNAVARGYSDIVKMEDKKEFMKRLHEQVLVKIALDEKRRKV